MNDFILGKVREIKPLVHHITNYVTSYDCASITLSTGALPVMACAEEEAADMAACAGALVLNIGTLSSRQITSMVIAGKQANVKGIPVILDPVGVGATSFRRASVDRILSQVKISIVKGNAAEISTLAGDGGKMCGVESIGEYSAIHTSAKNLAVRLDAVVSVTGERDIVTDGVRMAEVNNGHSMMGKVVGTGCMSASVIGSFCAVEKDFFEGVLAALSIFGIAGEKAAAV